jgi:broad specificity phosphatase PhoE
VTPLVLIRHGPTAWNAEGRMQGQSDVALSPEGRAAVAGWCLPTGVGGPDWRWVSSPLGRARETAAILAPGVEVRVEPALAEMSWGAWEGRLLSELRAEGGEAVADAEARGLDFRPPGGESPRDVQARVAGLLENLARAGAPVVAVAHKGVIRAIYALATGWTMTGRAPDKLRDGCAHRFDLGTAARPVVAELNMRLTP